ncbi:Uncharacterised protein [Vibrio cholerae]|nr:Uncharacterised protein [Vibrio cholerae]CSD49078.1 Uncharacterised protein [Vibrio cholerae]
MRAPVPLWGLAARAEHDLQSLPSQHPQADALLDAQCLALYTPRSPPQTDDPPYWPPSNHP